MNLPSETVIAILTYLLPGFFTAAIVYTLTPAPRPIPFERVVQALIFTMIVQLGVSATGFTLRWAGLHWYSVGLWTEPIRLGWSVALAGSLGLFLAWAANTDRIHELLRALGVTCQTSFSSEWYGAFSRNEGYVVLHLTGQRRLYGWLEEWPNQPDHGHFVVAQAEWLEDDKRKELTGVYRILIKAQEVEMVEMMEVDTHGRSQATDATTSSAEYGTATDDRRQNPVAPAPVQASTATATAGEEIAQLSR
jgi:hypothetical protein